MFQVNQCKSPGMIQISQIVVYCDTELDKQLTQKEVEDLD